MILQCHSLESANLLTENDDSLSMAGAELKPLAKKAHQRCAFIRCCYLADALNCYGYKADCALYKKSNDLYLREKDFDEAMNRLIDTVRAKDQSLVD